MTEQQGTDLIAAVEFLQKSLAVTNGFLYGLVLCCVVLIVVNISLLFAVGIVRGRRS
jgi:hypothetical protein